ncbi:TonB family protein [Rhodobacterales bacterium HKCCE2091]|nr:TonB family protein [Rhodobacterales bacterium HKCCE2091]
MRSAGALAGTLALGLSLGLHGGAFAAWTGPEQVAMAGGGGAETALVGDSFADLAAGTVSGRPPETSVGPVVDSEAPLEPVTADARTVEPTVEATPSGAAQLAPAAIGTDPVLPATAVETEPVTPLPSPPNTQVAALEASPPLHPNPSPAPDRVVAATPPDVRTPDASTARPMRRPDPAAAVEPTPAPAPAVAAGNADRDALRGQPTGEAAAAATATGPARNAGQSAGNAAASTYPGLVMRQIQRARRRTDERGVALVQFSISGSGALGGLSIARSSGNPALDRIALATISSAAPFPAPPAGAQTNFSVEIAGR